MIKQTPIAMAFTLALLASTACFSIQAAAQQAAPDQQSQRQETLPNTAGRDAETARDRLADAKARLRLSTEQEKLWGPVEAAVRDLQARTRNLRSSLGDVRQNDQIERFRRLGEMSTQRGDALKRLADAVQPLWATLSDEQKREFPRFAGIAGRNDEDRTFYRGRNLDDDRGMDRRRYGDDSRDYDRRFGEDGRRRWGDSSERDVDDERGTRGRGDYRQRDRSDTDFRRGSQDSYRSREWDDDRRDRRSERRHGGCDDRD